MNWREIIPQPPVTPEPSLPADAPTVESAEPLPPITLASTIADEEREEKRLHALEIAEEHRRRDGRP